MTRKLTSSDSAAMVRLASSLEKGSDERRNLLAVLKLGRSPSSQARYRLYDPDVTSWSPRAQVISKKEYSWADIKRMNAKAWAEYWELEEGEDDDGTAMAAINRKHFPVSGGEGSVGFFDVETGERWQGVYEGEQHDGWEYIRDNNNDYLLEAETWLV